ncbi:MAG: transposase [Phycisphaerales bacterium]|nr:transposase [Phycisphaerales bacterium]
MFTVNKVTVLRLIADAGTLAIEYHDLTVRKLSTKRVQVDEIWSFVHSKERNVQSGNWGKGHGDTWTWVAMDADSKLAINWLVGGRDASYGREFVADLADRLSDRVQLTSDGWQVYRDAVKRAFGDNVDYAMLVKQYGTERQGYARYSPPMCLGCYHSVQVGNPAGEHINTSFIERQNLTMRMGMRRFTRLTNGFSKRAENHKFAIALHYFHYNFIRRHQTIKTTPAVMARITDKIWTMVDFVKLMEREEELLGGRISDYKPAKPKKAS